MKKGSKSCLFVAIALIGLCIIGLIAMASFKLCPPAGPWPLPPWCEGGVIMPKISMPGITTALSAMASPSVVVSTITDGKDSLGCFPSTCSLVQNPNSRMVCQDWVAGRKANWGIDCDTWTNNGCRTLCESNTIQKYLPSEVDIYGRPYYTDPADLLLTPTIIGWGVALGDNEPDLRWVKVPSKRGAKHISQVSIWNKDSWKQLGDLPPELKDAYVKGFDGEPLYIQTDVFLNILDPAYQQWLKDKMKLHIDAGTDGFVFDEHWGTSVAVTQGTGPFDEYSLAGFREYLKSRYSPQELKAQGVDDISTFNYRDFLVKNNYKERYQKSFGTSNAAPFASDYRRYLMLSVNDVITDLIDYSKSYAQQSGKTLVFAVNGDPLRNTDEYTFFSKLDFFEFEHEWFPAWRKNPGSVGFEAGVPITAKMKYTAGLGKPGVTMPYGGSDSTLFSQLDANSGTFLILHQFAEAYANRGFYIYSDFNYLGEKFSADRAPLRLYHAFIREQPAAFKDLSTYAETAVLRPSHALVDEQSGLDAIQGFADILGEANVPYDVVDIDKIADYRVVLTGGPLWTDAEIETLLAYVQNGGTLIASDSRFGSRDQNNQPVNRPPLRALMSNGIHSLGKGKFVFFTEDLWYKIWAQRNQIASEKIVAAVKQQGITPNTAPANVQLLPYVAEGKFVLHILNYDFSNSNFQEKKDFQVQVRLPADYSTVGKTLKIISPDFEGNQTATFDQSGDMITFTVPSLYIWDVIILE